jgi:hypothetical protein
MDAQKKVPVVALLSLNFRRKINAIKKFIIIGKKGISGIYNNIFEISEFMTDEKVRAGKNKKKENLKKRCPSFAENNFKYLNKTPIKKNAITGKILNRNSII